MNISWHTKTCVEINASSKKEGNINIIIDSLIKEGLSKGKKINADLFIFSKKEKQKQITKEKEFYITGPGEYEIKEVYVKGIEVSPTKTIYLVDVEDIRICHLGLIEQEELLSSQIEEMGDIDILFIPIGGGESLDPKKAVKIMGQLEPRITIPINYEKDKEKKEFLNILGIKSVETSPKLSIKKKTILEGGENSKVIILE